LSGPTCSHYPTRRTHPPPARELSLATETLTATLNGIATARDVGLIAQTDINQYKPAIDGALAVRAQAEKDLRAGNVTNSQSAVSQIQALLIQLEPLLVKIADKKATTQPH
jgi:hypothetical protein